MTDRALLEAESWFGQDYGGKLYELSELHGNALIAEVKRLRDKVSECNRRATDAEGQAARHRNERDEARAEVRKLYDIEDVMSGVLKDALGHPDYSFTLWGLVDFIVKRLKSAERERNQIATDYDRMRAERDELKASLARIAADRDEIDKLNNELSKTCGELRAKALEKPAGSTVFATVKFSDPPVVVDALETARREVTNRDMRIANLEGNLVDANRRAADAKTERDDVLRRLAEVAKVIELKS
jgi:chromosome segregation ATPase